MWGNFKVFFLAKKKKIINKINKSIITKTFGSNFRKFGGLFWGVIYLGLEPT